jgi:hypothetical protein
VSPAEPTIIEIETGRLLAFVAGAGRGWRGRRLGHNYRLAGLVKNEFFFTVVMDRLRLLVPPTLLGEAVQASSSSFFLSEAGHRAVFIFGI